MTSPDQGEQPTAGAGRALGPWIPPGSILAGVDGSADSARAVRWAVEEAASDHRPLVLVTAVDLARLDTESCTEWLVEPKGRASQELREDALRTATAAADLVQATHPGLAVCPLAIAGDARCVLIDLSRRAHSIVIGARGHGRLRSLLLGSVSAGVTRHALCPVVVCRRSEGPAGQGVAVVADRSPGSRSTVEFAFAQAELAGLQLTVAPCTDAISRSLAPTMTRLSEKYPDVRVRVRSAHELVDAIAGRATPWDLVVVGRHPLDSAEQWIAGAFATTVLERARTTVAVVPEDAEWQAASLGSEA
jgi:nucleotide-binding universal stress UspA family protein